MNRSLDYYQMEGGTLPLIGFKSATYVKRNADEELYQFCRSSHASNRVCSILAPRQMGKSSLMVRIAERLSNEGAICIQINLQGLGGVRSEDSFWYTILEEICKQLDRYLQDRDPAQLAIDRDRSFAEKMDEQWSKKIQQTAASKVTNFLIEEILQKLEKDCQFVLFFDEIQSLIALGFQNSVIGYIKALGDDVRQKSLQKFNIVLLGVIKPADLLQERQVTLNIGRQVELSNLDGNCQPLQKGLESITRDPSRLISLILSWTNGQPFLTQLLCFLAVQVGAKDASITWDAHLEKIVREKMIQNWRTQDRQSHFQEIENYFIYGDRHKNHNLIEALNYYKMILQQGSILWNRTKDSLWDLSISGLARKEIDGDRTLLKINNKIYEQIFNLHWVETTQNTITQLEEEIPSMTFDRAALINEVMNRDLLPELSSFVNRVMSENYGTNWQENREILEKFSRNFSSSSQPQRLELDLSTLLSLVDGMWRTEKNQNFFNTLKREDRDLAIGIKNYLKTISHFTNSNREYSTREASSAIDTIIRLLQAISASESVISKVRGIHRELLQQLLAEESKTQPISVSKQSRNIMQRVQQIEKIILQRQPLAAKIKTVEENLNSLVNTLDELEQRRIELLAETNADRPLNALNFSAIRYSITRERDRLEGLRKRLSRNTLNLGVVGLMGQGKSTLLQHLSGLDNDVIPAKVGGACTAVRSTICHQEGDTYAEVIVHSEESFLKEVIRPYYVELNLGMLPQNLEEFARSLPDFSGGDATLNSMYEHLKKDYRDNLSYYRTLLQSGSPRQLPRVSKQEIYKYVSQPRNDRGELIGFEHLIVRSVKIFCPFPNRDVGKIALVDVPGLGDTRLGDEQLILETLGQEIDLVLFIRRPDALRFVWEKRDTDLYKTANQALNNLENRSFLILNHVRGNNNNFQACEALKATYKAKYLKTIRCDVIDCSNAEEANVMLDSILDYLAANIKALDDQYARTYQDRLDRLHQQIQMELQQARQNRSSEMGMETLDDSDRFDALFERLWTRLARNLEELVYDFDWEKQNGENSDFQQQVAITIENCKTDTGLPLTPEQEPDIEQILDRRASSGGWSSAYEEYLHDIRTHLTRKFESMDMGLQKYVDLAKSIVTDVLIEAVNLDNLPGLSGRRGKEFIESAIAIIPPRCTNLGSAFKTLSEFEMTYRKTFRSHIRPYLSNLNPNRTNLRITAITGEENRETRSQMAQTIFDYLEILQGEAVSKCEIALADLSSEPNKEAFYEIEQFVDQILRSGGSKQEWRSFLRQKKEYIWPTEFGRMEERSPDWLELIERVEAANQLQKLQFLN
ncbi:MAG: AAA-like domain-containing protein [Cyanobacteria bacterium P01_E01_bin.42]